MDSNIREAIELVLEVKIEDGENIKNLTPVESALPEDETVRKWEISVQTPEGATVGS